MAEQKDTAEWGSGNQTATEPKRETKRQPKQLPPYHVVLMNDDDHTYEYVIQMLRAVFAYSEEKGYQLAKQVDDAGQAVVFTSHREYAELKREQIHSYGADFRISSCKGSMSAIIQPA
jgi:ATP-dependent Clp protease adaptor protein ClpS